MNDAHLHLLVNHLPIVFPIVGIIVLLTGLLSKSEPVKRTAYLIFILSAFCALAAMTTGEEAEHFVENLNGFGHDPMEEHEESAETFAMLSYALATVSVVALWLSFKAKKVAGTLSFIVLAFALVNMYFAQQTGTSGGEIKHDEISSGASVGMPDHED